PGPVPVRATVRGAGPVSGDPPHAVGRTRPRTKPGTARARAIDPDARPNPRSPNHAGKSASLESPEAADAVRRPRAGANPSGGAHAHRESPCDFARRGWIGQDTAGT